jgi:D-glycero-D-manno-heptose 1,7-bisphosphate phosphatase
MNKAIFLDRDGVINSDIGHYYVYRQADLKINDGIIQSLQRFQTAGFLLIIISNQGGIAKGEYSKADTDLFHSKLNSIFAENNIFIGEIYYCPHHSEIEKCICRKPDSQLIEKAMARFKIDVENSFFIGDSERDIKAAKKVKLNTLKIDSNQNISDICTQILARNDY